MLDELILFFKCHQTIGKGVGGVIKKKKVKTTLAQIISVLSSDFNCQWLFFNAHYNPTVFLKIPIGIV